MSLLKKAIDAKRNGTDQLPQPLVEISIKRLAADAIATLSHDGVITTPSGEGVDGVFLTALLDFESLPTAAMIIRANQYMELYEQSRIASKNKGVASKTKKKKDTQTSAVRDRYI